MSEIADRLREYWDVDADEQPFMFGQVKGV
jgi:hypothetical protein